MLKWHPVLERMRLLTEKKVEKKACFELVNYTEDYLNRIIVQSIEEFEKLNDFRRKQGLYQKVMIDVECVINAIKTINSHDYSLVPNKAGGCNESCDRKVGVLNGKMENNASENQGVEVV